MNERYKNIKILLDIFGKSGKPLSFYELQYETEIDPFALMTAIGTLLTEHKVTSFVSDGKQYFQQQ